MKTILKKIFNILGYKLHRLSSEKLDLWPSSLKNPQTVYEIEKDFHIAYNEAMIKTEMIKTDNPLRRNRHYLLSKLIKEAPISDGEVSECGCWKGLSAYIIAAELKKRNYKNKFYIFDSFEGLSKLDKQDEIKDKNNFDENEIRKYFAYSLDRVKKNLEEFKDMMVIYKGWIPSTFKEVEKKTFSFVHIDVDLYKPILDSFNFFWPKMTKGGIILFDDYGSMSFPGAKLAVDEFLKNINKNEYLFVPLSFGSAIIVKK